MCTHVVPPYPVPLPPPPEAVTVLNHVVFTPLLFLQKNFTEALYPHEL